MAKPEPKLGDVLYQRATGTCPYDVQYFCGGHWTDFSGESRLSDAKFEQAALAFALSAVIREAREKGVNDAIAVVQKLSDEWTGCTLDDVYDDAIALIREKTGVKP